MCETEQVHVLISEVWNFHWELPLASFFTFYHVASSIPLILNLEIESCYSELMIDIISHVMIVLNMANFFIQSYFAN